MPARKLSTYADIEALPPHQTGQIIDGELYVSPRPAFAHANTASRLGMLIGTAYAIGIGGPGGWHILDEPELHLGSDVLVPDLAGWTVERLPNVEGLVASEIAPDWACEVLSPSTERLDRGRKRAAYARHGVRWLWLIHPTQHIVEVLELRGRDWVLKQVKTGNDSLRAAPFDAIEIDLHHLWWNPPEDDSESPGA